MASTENQKLAEKLLKILESGTNNSDLATLFASIEKINHRLDKLEASNQTSTSIPTSNHPSLEKFSIAEAIADAIFDVKTKEKACTFEPNGKPCDHCSMCNSRGF